MIIRNVYWNQAATIKVKKEEPSRTMMSFRYLGVEITAHQQMGETKNHTLEDRQADHQRGGGIAG